MALHGQRFHSMLSRASTSPLQSVGLIDRVSDPQDGSGTCRQQKVRHRESRGPWNLWKEAE